MTDVLLLLALALALGFLVHTISEWLDARRRDREILDAFRRDMALIVMESWTHSVSADEPTYDEWADLMRAIDDERAEGEDHR